MGKCAFKRFIPKKLHPLAVYLFDHVDLWLKVFLIFSKKRKSSLASCLSFSSPLLIKRQDITYELNPSDIIQRRILFGFYEDESLSAVLHSLKEGDIFLDIGANVGFYTLNAAKKVGEKGKVFCIEADPQVFEKLNKNINLNSFCKNTSSYHVAISNQKGEVAFVKSEDPKCSGYGSLYAFSGGQKIVVPSTTLDDFLYQHNISRVTCLKVDIEASEIKLLEGASQALQKGTISNILIEFNGERLYQLGYNFNQFYSFFLDNNYSCTFNQPLLEKIQSGTIDPSRLCENFMFSRTF